MHRDLKPANILLDGASGIAALADFGIAKRVDDQSGLARSFVGTAAYMAPERLNAEDYSSAADLWSLGMMALECAQGVHPWRHATSYYELIVEIAECAHPPRLPDDGRFSPPLRDFASGGAAHPAGFAALRASTRRWNARARSSRLQWHRHRRLEFRAKILVAHAANRPRRRRRERLALPRRGRRRRVRTPQLSGGHRSQRQRWRGARRACG